MPKSRSTPRAKPRDDGRIMSSMTESGTPHLMSRSEHQKRVSKARGLDSIGTKAQVAHGTADKTSGGLKAKDIMKNKHGKYVSIARHNAGKKQYAKIMRSPSIRKLFVDNQHRIAAGKSPRRSRSRSRKSTKSSRRPPAAPG